MDFRREMEALLGQIPEGFVARLADVARALGDVRASVAVFRFLREHPEIPGSRRVVSGSGPSTANARFFTSFRTDPPLAKLRAEQLALAGKVSRRTAFRSVHTVGGVDVSYDGDLGFVALVVLRASDLAVMEELTLTQRVEFPYIPTYLAYREWPLIEAAFRRLGEPPTVLLVDGHGQLHPARCGIASLVGVTLNVPTIGVAKNLLVGAIDGRPEVGAAVPVRYERRVLGYALRPGPSSKLLFVSTGHMVAPRVALRVVKSLCRTHHPEPLRLAHLIATEMKRRKGKRFEEGSPLAPIPRSVPGAKGRSG